MKKYSTLLIFFLLFSTSQFSQAQDKSEWLQGLWEGEIKTDKGTMTVRLTVRGRSYAVAYSAEGCEGSWSVYDMGSKKAVFVEGIGGFRRNPSCPTGNKVTVEKVNDNEVKFKSSYYNSFFTFGKGTLRRVVEQSQPPTAATSSRTGVSSPTASVPNASSGGRRTGQTRGSPMVARKPVDWEEKKRNGVAYRQQLLSSGYNIGKLLKETSSYKLYGWYRPLSNLPEFFTDWCADEAGWAAVSLVFKVDARYQIDNNVAYWGLFEREMYPEILAQCPSLDHVFITNFVDGYQIHYGSQEVVWNPQPNLESQYQSSSGISIAAYVPNSPGDSKYRWFFGQGGTGNLEQIIQLVRQGREPRIYGERRSELDDKSITSVARLQELWKDVIAKREEERRLKAEEEKQRLMLELERKRAAHRAKASTVLGLYKRGGGHGYDFTGYNQKEDLENIFAGNFYRFTGGHESSELQTQQLNYLGILLGGGSIESAMARMNEQLAKTKDIVSRRLPIMIAYFAYHQAYEKQCFPSNQELPWTKGSYRTDLVYTRGAFEVNRIEGQTYVFYVREPFFEAFDNTYRAAQEGQLVQFLTEVPLSTRTSYESDFQRFLQKEGCSSPRVRSLEVNLYLASEWLLPLQELLPAELLQTLPTAPTPKVTSSSSQKTLPKKNSTTKKPLTKTKNKPGQ